MTVSFLLWLGAGDSYAMLVLFAIVMGVAYGGFIALAPAVAAGLFGTVGLGAILGALYTAAAIGGLVGPPIVGDDHRPVLLRGRASSSPWCLTAAATVVLFMLPAGHDRAGRRRQALTPIPPSGWRNVPVIPRDRSEARNT